MGEQRGAFIVFTALAMWFLMMFVAFSVDFGNYYQHRSRLQNAADAAALAGVAEYTTEELAANGGTTVSVSTLGKGRLIMPVEGGNDASDRVKLRSREYVKKNYGEIEIKDNKVWSEDVTEETIENGVTTSVKTTHRYCRVDLEDTVQTFFARIFGVDSLTVKVSALAMMDGANTHKTMTVNLKQIAENLSSLAPNIGWETIHYSKRTHTLDGVDIDPYSSDEIARNRYVISDYVRDPNRYGVKGVTGLGVKFEKSDKGTRYDGTGYILGYREPENKEGVGQPIYLKDETKLTEANNQVGTTTFNINSSLYSFRKRDIFALFIDRDNIMKEPGNYERFCTLNIGSIGTAVGENPEVPLYIRIESEPQDVGGAGTGLTTVCSIDINLDTGSLNDAAVKMNPKPVVVIYEGPQQKREAEDAPWIPRTTTTVKSRGKDYNLNPGEIKYQMLPLPDYDGEDLKRNCIKTAAPVVLNIPEGYTLNGLIYMPRSQITIKGTGKINGFILAKKIINKEALSGCQWYSFHDYSLPTVSLESIGKVNTNEKEMIFKNDVITGDFEMAYTPGVEDYSDKAYYLKVAGFTR